MSENGADALLGQACAHFIAAAEGRYPACNAATGLRALLLATDHPDVFTASAQLVGYLRDAFNLAWPSIVEDASATLSQQHVAFALGMACGLLHYVGRPVEELRCGDYQASDFEDKSDYAALLAAELEEIHRWRRIEARGLRTREFVDMKLGYADARPAEQLLH